MRIGLLQYDISQHHANNIAKIDFHVKKIAKDYVQLIILPELCLSGYGEKPNSIFNTEDDQYIDQLISIAKENRCILLGGFCIKENNKYYNRLLGLS